MCTTDEEVRNKFCEIKCIVFKINIQTLLYGSILFDKRNSFLTQPSILSTDRFEKPII